MQADKYPFFLRPVPYPQKNPEFLDILVYVTDLNELMEITQIKRSIQDLHISLD